MEEPLLRRISRSTWPKDMRPNVRPDMIPAKSTSRQDTPAYKNHQGVGNLMSSGSKTMSFKCIMVGARRAMKKKEVK